MLDGTGGELAALITLLPATGSFTPSRASVLLGSSDLRLLQTCGTIHSRLGVPSWSEGGLTRVPTDAAFQLSAL